MKTSMKQLITKLIEHQKLTFSEAKKLIYKIAQNEANESQMAAVLTAYIMRNITIEELQGFRSALIELALRVNLNNGNVIDLCGTGGDGKNTFNISTISSFVAAAAGVLVAKHGNYGVSSISGSSNVMEQLGYRFSNDEAKLQNELEKTGVCFMHAPLFHPALKAVGPVRKQLGVKTFFNLLGPLVNPADPKFQVSGVFSAEVGRIYSYFLQSQNKRFSVVYSLDGYDEVSLTSPIKLFSQNGETLLNFENYGFNRLKPKEILGGETVEESAKIFLQILSGKGTKAQNDVIIANSALAISCYFEDKSLESSIEIAADALKSGKALKVFNNLINMQ